MNVYLPLLKHTVYIDVYYCYILYVVDNNQRDI